MAAAVALNGTFGIVTYAWSILMQAGISINPELQSFIVPILLLFGTIFPLTFVERAGRKPLLVGGFVTSGLAMCGLASVLLAQASGAVVPGWALLLCIAVAVMAYSAGVVSMPTVIMIDMFRFQVRAKILSPIFMFTLVVLSIYLAIYDTVINAFGLHAVFFLSTAANFLGAMMVLVWVPETKGRTVEQIEALLVGKR